MPNELAMRQQIGQLIDCENRYRRHWSDFTKLWSRVKEDWRDERSRRFEQEHLAALPNSLNRLTAAMRDMQDAMRRAEQGLADPDS